jgi:lantibiotic leader peptide-processing serine protease
VWDGWVIHRKRGKRMRVRTVARAAVLATAFVVLAAMVQGTSVAAPSARSGRYLVLARDGAGYKALRAKALSGGAKVVNDMPQVGALVVSGPDSVRGSLAADSRAVGVASDHRQRVAPVDERQVSHLSAPGLRSATRVRASARAGASAGITPDPAFGVPGLQWDFRRIGLPRGWRTSAGSSQVTVAVADTGVDFTHSELESKVTQVVDLTRSEAPPICKSQFGVSDDDLARQNGGPPTTDWNGHGSWIGGNIAAALDGRGINGIAPRVNLVSLKISQWCGSAYDSTLIDSFILAADLGVDVVNISFGGYLDRSDPDQDLIYRTYVAAVRYARSKGTVIAAAAGNEHTRVGAGGQVLSHGTLTTPGEELFDAFGQFEVPGGIPGVVDVASTGNVVNASSASCPPGTTGTPAAPNATCKPASDAHQAAGVGRQNQLSYFSNYGPRIDIAAPGGARKFNLPVYDRGGTPGFPYTPDADGTSVWEDFSTTSNWATQIDCFTIAGGGFPANQCYTSIQGTSMATPHVAAALALIASAHPSLRGDVGSLVARLKSSAVSPGSNLTQVLSATDTSPGDLSGVACASGYCHLGGATISNAEAYGAGLLNVSRP